MRTVFSAALLALMIVVISIQSSVATSLHVTPVTIDVVAPSGAGLLNLRNDDISPVTVQLRVFKWVQQNGEDKLVPTSDVVASPPMTKLAPGSQQTVRVVRVAKSLNGQASYRLLIDEVPQKSRQTRSGVRFLIRQSIPVFFSAPTVDNAKASWRLAAKGRQFTLTGRNTGADRLKVSELLIKDKGGRVLARVNGLAGYVLGRSTRSWTFDLPRGAAIKGSSVALSAESDKGPIRANVTISSGG